MSILDDARAVAVLIRSTRIIGYLIPHVVIEEINRDTLFVTQHPVEKGAAISDHAFKLPAEIEMTCGWSNSSVGAAGFADIVYQAMLQLQETREPFRVYTPGRIYRDMLVKGVERTTTAQTGGSLIVRVALTQIIIVATETAAVGHPASSQAIPQKTTTPTASGTKQLRPSGIGSA